MTTAVWSNREGRDCIALLDVPPDASIEVRTGTSEGDPGVGAFVGTWVHEGLTTFFFPRYPFLHDTSYCVMVDGVAMAPLRVPRPHDLPVPHLEAILPDVVTVPRNLLRFHLRFSHSMSLGCASTSLRVEDETGQVLPGVLFATEDELWDPNRQQLTVLLDPGQIKRGLMGHVEVGYPLTFGSRITLVVDPAFRDAHGQHLGQSNRRTYEVGADLRGHVDPSMWRVVGLPSVGSRDPLAVGCDHPLDAALAKSGIGVSCEGTRVDGSITLLPGQEAWSFTPVEPWRGGDYMIDVSPDLEDLAGNSVTRVFDRDLDDPMDAPRFEHLSPLRFAPVVSASSSSR